MCYRFSIEDLNWYEKKNSIYIYIYVDACESKEGKKFLID